MQNDPQLKNALVALLKRVLKGDSPNFHMELWTTYNKIIFVFNGGPLVEFEDLLEAANTSLQEWSETPVPFCLDLRG
jgi:hypothetical protein